MYIATPTDAMLILSQYVVAQERLSFIQSTSKGEPRGHRAELCTPPCRLQVLSFKSLATFYHSLKVLIICSLGPKSSASLDIALLRLTEAPSDISKFCFIQSLFDSSRQSFWILPYISLPSIVGCRAEKVKMSLLWAKEISLK